MEIIAAGPFTTVQDLGRPGYGHLGVSPSGALDHRSFRLANRLVGNPESAAALEVTFGGLRFRLARLAWIAVTGASLDVWVGDLQHAANTPLAVPANTEVRLGWPSTGVRSYVAITGGIAIHPVLGSRSTDMLSGLGQPALRAGDRLAVGTARPAPLVDVAPVAPVGPVGGRDGGPDGETLLNVFLGPRDDWFEPAALTTLFHDAYRVTDRADRVGMRLAGPPLLHRIGGELPTEGVVTGSLQVPPDGQPIIFLNDHPTTGGYPVIAVVRSGDLPRAAQARPGTLVRFRRVS